MSTSYLGNFNQVILSMDESSAYVGIGSLYPSYKLDVLGHTRVSSNLIVLGNLTNTGVVTLCNTTNILSNVSVSGAATFCNTMNAVSNVYFMNPATFSNALIMGSNYGSVTISTSNGSLEIAATSLEVDGKVRASQQFIGTSGAATYPGFAFSVNSNTGLFLPAQNNIALSTGGVERLRVNELGFCGIGTSSPCNMLEVQGNTLLNGNLNVLGALTVSNVTYVSSNVIVYVNETINSNLYVENSLYAKSNIIITGYGNIAFSNNSGIGTLSSSNGFLGVATSVPTESLDVAGKIKASQQFLGAVSDSSNTPSFTFVGNSNTGIYRPGTDTLGIVTSGVERGRVDALGNWGVGLSNPSTILDVKANKYVLFQNQGADFSSSSSNRATVILSDPSPGYGTSLVFERNGLNGSRAARILHSYNNFGETLAFYVSGAVDGVTNVYTKVNPALLLQENGNVGISKSNPDYALDVNGTVNATSFYINGVQLSSGGGSGTVGSTSDTSNAPSFTWGGDSSTGMYHAGTGQIGFATAGVNRLTVDSTGLTVSGAGTLSAPSLSGSCISTAVNSTSNNVAATSSAVKTAYDLANASLPASGGSVTGNVTFTAGQIRALNTDSVTVPSFTWNGDSNTGMYHAAAGQIGFTTAGVNRLLISSNGIGVGTASPAYSLDVAGTIRTTGSILGGSGDNSFVGPYVGSANLGFVKQSGAASRICYNNVNPFKISMMSQADITQNISSATYTDRLVISNTGNVGIGIASPLYPLHVGTSTSNISIFSAYDIVAFSDARLKSNLLPISNALEKINKISGYTYERVDNVCKDRFAGVIAQEVAMVLPEVVRKDDNGMLNVAYGNLSALLIEGIKELSGRSQKAICSGRALLKNGKAEVQVGCDMISDPDIFIQNNETWDRVMGKMTGSTLTILCENPSASHEVVWMILL